MPNDISILPPNDAQWPEIRAVLESRNFHHIGGPEMPSFPLSDCLVAVVDDVVRGVGGWRTLSDTEAKKTLLAVAPAWAHLGLGRRLQTARLGILREMGMRSVTTNTDDPRVAHWLERKHGFRKTGDTVPKEADFGNPDIDHWTTLRVDWPKR